MGNIEFAVEINTSLIGQVRQLQSVLTERDEALKLANAERSRLEAEAEGFAQRLKSMDESEQRYKDENWNLETQTHEMIAAAKEATSREQKLQQLLVSTTAEKNAANRELDDLKQNHGRLVEDVTMIRKSHDVELAALRKNMNLGETEKGALKRKVEELTTQNQELAKAITARFRDAEVEAGKDADSEPEDPSMDHSEPEHSPPPSPTKGVPRHAMLESETLKSSLHHAHRMIQSLKSNIHREKTEKTELKRQLQEVRDELEVRKKEPGGMISEIKKSRFKPQPDSNRKIRSTMLGAGRESKIHILADDPEWEEHNGDSGSYQDEAILAQRPNNEKLLSQGTDMSDAYQTANETEDAFETANELESATENETYHPAIKESLVESNDELTETEDGPARGRTIRGGRPSLSITGKPGDRSSYQSTASTSGDEDEQSNRTPVQQPQKYRLKIHRGPRRSRMSVETVETSTPPSAKNSPASFVGGGSQEGQSLFNELGGLSMGENGEETDGTPSKGSTPFNRSISSINRNFGQEQSTSSVASSSKPTQGVPPPSGSSGTPQIPRRLMVDSATMTDPYEPVQGYQSKPRSGSIRLDPHVDDDPFVSKPVSVGSDSRKLQESAPVENSTMTTGWPNMMGRPLGSLSNMTSSFGRASHSMPTMGKPAARDVDAPRISEEVTSDIQTSQNRPENNKQDLQDLQTAPQRSTVNGLTSTKITTPTLSLSSIQSLEIAPLSTPQLHATHDARRWTPSSALPAGTADTTLLLPTKPNVERIMNTIFGSDSSELPLTSHPAETETTREGPPLPQRDGRRPRQGSSSSLLGQPRVVQLQNTEKPSFVDVADQSSQTLLSSHQIDRMLLLDTNASTLSNQPAISPPAAGPPASKPLSDIGASSSYLFSQRSVESKDSNKGKQPEQPAKDLLLSTKVPRRPLSSASMRSRNGQYPPLPPDHQQAIAAAAQKGPSVELPTGATGAMGPPPIPTSAYRASLTRPRTPSRPRTPNQQPLQSPASKNVTTPRVRHSASKSQVSRRSSFSSFASELDERFNIRISGLPGPYSIPNGTDPRMIQAITQTMIGEFLWKYTRKAGRGDMSSNRHRRFFWVHPYTRTLYWSSQDPAIAGRAEVKAKSVGIEAVQVVIDDNPMPPGLHRKSLVIFTPGRCIKLTATTGQRHETWFNALSYLLHRTSPEGAQSRPDDGTLLSPEDYEDFNPSLSRHASRTIGSRISLSSFRNSQRSENARAQSNLEVRQPQNPSQAAQSSVNNRHSQRPPQYHGSTSSRWSQYLKQGTSMRGSLSSRTSQSVNPHEQGSSQYANMAHDSAEDLRQVIEQQDRQSDQLENVRACCDG